MRYALIIIFVLALSSLFLVFSNPNSISTVVNAKVAKDTDITFTTWEKALSSCESQRSAYAKEGQVCEPCQTTCPSSATKLSSGLYTVNYGSDSVIYSGVFNNVKCDELSGGLLQVKSYCNDNIRLCQKQVGSGTVTSTTQVSNGKIQKISYQYQFVDCTTGKIYASTDAQMQAADAVSYQLVCNSGYTIDGMRTSSSPNNLGKCVSSKVDPTVDPLAGTFTQTQFPNETKTSTDAVVRVAFTAQQAGQYYIYGKFNSKATAFSIATAVSDLCGNDPSIAGVFVTLAKDETKIVQLEIPTPSSSGKYGVKVAARQGCDGADMDSKSSEVSVLQSQIYTTQPVVAIVTNDSEAQQKVSEYQDEIDALLSKSSCSSTDDLTVDGCAVAKCVDSQVAFLSDSEITSACQDVGDLINAAKSAPQGKTFQDYFDPSTTLGKSVIAIITVIVLAGAALLIFKE